MAQDYALVKPATRPSQARFAQVPPLRFGNGDKDGAAQEPTPSGWKSLSSDTRLFIVTFAGTVLANVVTIMVVAVAVIIARPRVSGQPKTAVNILWYIGLAAVSTVIVGGAVAYSRHRDKEGRDRRTGWLATGVVCGCLGLLCIMALTETPTASRGEALRALPALPGITSRPDLQDLLGTFSLRPPEPCEIVLAPPVAARSSNGRGVVSTAKDLGCAAPEGVRLLLNPNSTSRKGAILRAREGQTTNHLQKTELAS